MTALAATRVLELTTGVGGEYCGKLLSDFGAEVIKLEDPVSGSPTRRLQPLVAGSEGPEQSGLFAYLNTNKRSVALDVSTEAGRATVENLLARVDVLICDRTDNWLQTMELGDDQSQYPQLVVCSITPFGSVADGETPHAEDLNVFHSSGWGYHTPSAADPDRPPLKGAGRYLASYEAGLDAAMCIVAALYERETTQLGQFIDISKQATLASRSDYVFDQMIAGTMNVSHDRRAYDLHGPADIYPCRDGFVYLWMSAPTHWQALSTMLGAPEWMNPFPEDWLERECTSKRVAEVRHHVGVWLKTQHKADVAEAAQKLGLILVPVNNPGDLLQSPQYQYRGYFAELSHPVLEKAWYPTVPYRMSQTPAQLNSPAPLLGQHTDETLATLTAANCRGVV